MVEGARLESVYTGNCIKGSNPFLSASENAENTSAFFVYAISQHTGQNCDCAVLPVFFAVLFLFFVIGNQCHPVPSGDKNFPALCHLCGASRHL